MRSSSAEKSALNARLERRNENAFAEEERRGLMLASQTRTIALLVILLWQVLDNPNQGWALLASLGEVAIFAVLGLVQYVTARLRYHVNVLKYVFVLLDCALLAFIFSVDWPIDGVLTPPALAMESSRFGYFYIFLMQAAFSLRPRLVLWCGTCIVAVRTGMLLWFASRPGATSNFDLPEQTSEAILQAYSNASFIYLGFWATEMMAAIIVTVGLAFVVRRSRMLVEDRTTAERTRSSLARYFSPNVVDRLSATDSGLGKVREQPVAVLFADIIGFTGLCERESPETVIALLRDYHARFGQAVFDNGGTLDKYIGDGLMATFGTPETSPDDARNALQSAMDMLDALDVWNAERCERDEKPVRVGIGLHFGPVIAGDIGSERRLEYGVIGDTVNIASRLEQLTRDLNTPLVVSDRLISELVQSSGNDDGLLKRLSRAGAQTIRGRETSVEIWILDKTAPANVQ